MTIISTSKEQSLTIAKVSAANSIVYVSAGVVLISDYEEAIAVDQGATSTIVTNAGSLMGGPGALSVSADGATITNLASGLIQGGPVAVELSPDESVSTNLNNAGLIEATQNTGGFDFSAVLNQGTMHLVNTGTISGYEGIGDGGPSYGAFTSAVITNSGVIAATGDPHIAIEQSQLQLTNTGTIGGSVETTTTLAINNYGTIDGLVSGSNYVTIVNHGTISGGIIDNGGGNGTDNLAVTNGGKIDHDVTAGNTSTSDVRNDGLIIGSVTLGDLAAGSFEGTGGTVEGNITGGSGNDVFDLSHQIVGGAVYGGGGSDTIAFSSASAGIAIDLNQQTAAGEGESFTFSGIENATGSGFADTINGDDNVNTISGGAGNDIINGNGGADVINAGPGVDTVMGGPGNDVINGNGGNDILYGNGGADVIAGGSGGDTLSGGAGNDTFVYNLISDSTPAAPDRIIDFTHGSDKIDLTAIILSNANEVTITSSGGLTYVNVDPNHDGVPDMVIQVVGTNSVTMSDILVQVVDGEHSPSTVTGPGVTTVAHHDLAASLHAVTLDHGLYG